MTYLDDIRAQGLMIASRKTWGSVFTYGNQRPAFDPPGRYLFLHIGVVDDRLDTLESEYAGMRQLERIGTQRFPNTGISYNAAAFDTGRLYDGQPLTRLGAHTVNEYAVAGYPYNLNAYGHAIVLPQQLSDAVTDAQIEAVALWGAAVVRAGYSTATRFEPHRKFAPKECPGDRAIARLPEINDRLSYYIREGLDTMTREEFHANVLTTPIDNRVTEDDPSDEVPLGLTLATLRKQVYDMATTETPATIPPEQEERIISEITQRVLVGLTGGTELQFVPKD